MPRTRLTKDQVREIRWRYAKGESTGVMAADYGVARNTVCLAVVGKTWSQVPGAQPPRPRGRPGLTPEQVTEIKRQWALGASVTDLASAFGVARSTAWYAATGRSHRDVEAE